MVFFGFALMYASFRNCREVVNSQVSYALNPKKHAVLSLNQQKENLESRTSSAPKIDIVRTGVADVMGQKLYFEEWRYGAVLYYGIERDIFGKASIGDFVTKADLNTVR